MTLIYRYMWEQINGPVPDGHHLHHRCENKRCINPDHLEPLTVANHAQQHHKLTPADVAEIRAARGRERQIDTAKRFGVAQAHVSAIQLGKTWRE